MKKIITSLILCVSVILSICGSAYAIEQTQPIDENIQDGMLRILASIEFEKEYYGLAEVDFSSVEIGSEIATYRVVGNTIQENDALIFPVLNNGNIVSLFYAIEQAPGEWYVQLEAGIADKIDTYADGQPCAIIYENDRTYIYANEMVNLIDAGSMAAVSEANQIGAISAIPSVELGNIDQVNIGEVVPNEMGSICTLDVHEYINTLYTPYDVTIPNSAYLEVPIYQQPADTNYCWAICMASIVNCVRQTSYTPLEILDLVTGGVNQSMYIEQVVYYLNYYFSMNYTTRSASGLDSGYAVQILAAGYPIYARVTSTNNGTPFWHAMVVRGVNRVLNTISVMNPTTITTGYSAGTISAGTSNVWSTYSYGYLYSFEGFGYRIL